MENESQNWDLFASYNVQDLANGSDLNAKESIWTELTALFIIWRIAVIVVKLPLGPPSSLNVSSIAIHPNFQITVSTKNFTAWTAFIVKCFFRCYSSQFSNYCFDKKLTQEPLGIRKLLPKPRIEENFWWIVVWFSPFPFNCVFIFSWRAPRHSKSVPLFEKS